MEATITMVTTQECFTITTTIGNSNSNNSFRLALIWHIKIRYICSWINIEYQCHTSYIPSIASRKDEKTAIGKNINN